MPERLLDPITTAELERRRAAVQKIAAERRLDAMLVQNSNNHLGGYVHWLSALPAYFGYPRTLILDPEARMVLVEQGPRDGEQVPPPEHRTRHGIDRIVTTPSFTSAAFTAGYDARLAAAELRRTAARRVGWINPAGAYHGFGHALRELCPEIEFIDVTGDVDAVKAVKSAEEQELVRRTAALQDHVIGEVRDFLKPGLRDFEIVAYARYAAQRRGSDQDVLLASSSPPGEPAVFRWHHERGRTIGPGDVFTLLVETNGLGGIWTEIGRTFVLGRPPDELVTAFRAVRDARRAVLDDMTPGRSCAEIEERHNARMRRIGLPEEERLLGHGQGHDLVERPLLRADESMRLDAGMNLAVHPQFVLGGAFALICDNYLIGPDGPGARLHATPAEIIEI